MLPAARILLTTALGSVASLCAATPAGPQDDPAHAPDAFRVTVELAVVQAVVRDGRGQEVRGLTADRFRILEDGEPREIVLFAEEPEAPLQVAFLLDVSGSMGLQGRLTVSRSGVRNFLHHLDPYDEAALFAFADGALEVLVDFTTDRWAVRNALLSRQGYGRTALLDAVARAPGLVPREGSRRGAIVLFSDGVDNMSRLGLDQAVDLARRTEVPVYAVGLLDRDQGSRRQQGEHVLQRFARETGGEAYFADDPLHVNRYLRRVAEDLKRAYVLGFYPSPGGHALRIEAACKGCRVVARQGVYAAAPGD